MTTNNHGLDADEVTLPAGGDVVAQIREHAAKVRRGEVAADEDVQIWTPDADDVPAEPEPPVEEVPVEEVLVEVPEAAIVSDVIAPPEIAEPEIAQPEIAELPPVQDLRRSGAASGEGVSLIEGLAPPDTSAEFWTSDRPFRASGIDAKPRRQLGAGRLWIWVVLVVLLIVAASVGIALAVATTGPAL